MPGGWDPNRLNLPEHRDLARKRWPVLLAEIG